MKPIAPQTRDNDLHPGELLSFIGREYPARSYFETENISHISIPLGSASVLIKDIWQDVNCFKILENN